MADRLGGWQRKLVHKLQFGVGRLALCLGIALLATVARAQPASGTDEKKEEKSPAKEVFGRLIKLSDADVKSIDEAVEELKNTRIDSCRDKLKEARTKNPGLPPASMMLARLLIAANQSQAAIAELEKCVLDNPTDPDAYLFQGDLAMQQGMVSAADLLFKEAEKLLAGFKDSPDRKRDFEVRIHAGASAVNEAREQWPEAKARLEAWIGVDKPTGLEPKTEPNERPAQEVLRRSAAHQRLANVYVQLGDYEKALASIRTAAGLNSEMISPAATLGILCYQSSMRAKNTAAAIKDEKSTKKAELTEKATKLQVEATKRMGTAYSEINTENPTLIAAFKKADADLKAAESKGAPGKPIKDAYDAVQLKKQRNLRGLLSVADYLLVTKQLVPAQNVSDAALLLDDKSIEAKTQRGIVARFQKNYAEAEKYLSEAQQMAPGAFLPSNHLALVLAEQGQELEETAKKLEDTKKDEAKAAREKARELKQRAIEYAVINQRSFNKNVEAAATVAWVSYLRGDQQAAAQVLDKIIQAGGLSADSAYYAGKILSDLKKWELALQFLEAAKNTTVPFFHSDDNSKLLPIVTAKVDEIKKDREKEKKDASK